MKGYLRGQLARAANVNIETLRYYEQIRIIEIPERNESGYRVYNKETLIKLQFIKQAKECGFSLEEIQQIFTFVENPEQCLDHSNQLIANKIGEIDKKIKELQEMRTTLLDIESNVNSGNCSYFYNMI